MADTKTSALTALAATDVVLADDVMPIVDTSATATKKITVSALQAAVRPGLASFIWTFAAGGAAPATGTFTTNNDTTPSSVSSIRVSFFVKNNGTLSYQGLLAACKINTILLLTNSAGKTYAFYVSVAPVIGGSDAEFALIPLVSDAVAWSGDYAVTFSTNTPTTAASGTYNFESATSGFVASMSVEGGYVTSVTVNP